jgi:hypothetical protein
LIFLSEASNLTPGDSLFSNDLFVANRVGEQSTSLVSTANSSSRDARGVPSVSDVGTLFAYQQTVTNDQFNGWGVFLASEIESSKE